VDRTVPPGQRARIPLERCRATRGQLSSTGFGGVQFESKGEIDVLNLLQPKKAN
jgi:hypothetical protein